MALTFSPDPPHLLAGAGTAAEQTARGRMYADYADGGWTATAPATATAATAGTPGRYTAPENATAPADFAAMTPVGAIPLTAWTTGQYVNVGDGTTAYWSGTAWTVGKAP